MVRGQHQVDRHGLGLGDQLDESQLIKVAGEQKVPAPMRNVKHQAAGDVRVSGCQSGGGWSTVNCVEPWFQVDGAAIVRTGMQCVRTWSRSSEAPGFCSFTNPDGITSSPI